MPFAQVAWQPCSPSWSGPLRELTSRGEVCRSVALLLLGIPLVVLLLATPRPAWGQESPRMGVVTALTGRADLKRPNVPQAPLKVREDLYVRDIVDTKEQSVARILLMGKSSVTVRELSRFEIREETQPDGAQRALINLVAGKIRVMVAYRLMKVGDEVRIQTPNAVASVRGTDGIFEVSILPDGRPQTVITGVSGEFELTLPSAPPFVTRGQEFLPGLIPGGRTSHRSPLLIAMAPVTSGAGPALQLGALPSRLITGGRQVSITDVAGVQTLTTAFLTLQQLNQLIGAFRIHIGATGVTQPPSSTTDKIAAQGLHSAQSENVGGFAVAGGLGTGLLQPSVILPTNFISLPPPPKPPHPSNTTTTTPPHGSR